MLNQINEIIITLGIIKNIDVNTKRQILISNLIEEYKKDKQFDKDYVSGNTL